jgi:hypothetical protein
MYSKSKVVAYYGLGLESYLVFRVLGVGGC